MNKKELKRYGIWSLVVISVVTLFIGIFKLAGTQTVKYVKPPKINENDQVKGNRLASVIVVEYSDFQCPACKFYHPLIKQLTDEYKDEIAFVYRHFPLGQHKNAKASAYAAEAAGLQGKYWEMSDLLFDNQEDWSEKSEAPEIFKTYAKKLELNLDRYNKDIQSSSVKEKVEKDRLGGESISVNATPTFYLNGIKLKNIRSYDDFKQAIEERLN